MKKVLFITYQWPPAGGPGVQRVLKFVKYLPQMGWQPLVLTVKNGEYPAIDESLINEIPDNIKVFKTASFEPNRMYKKFVGMKNDEHIPTAILAEKDKNRKQQLAAWIRLNLFVPDAKRGWLPYALKQGQKIIREEKPDLIFSSSPPPTVHLIGRNLARKSSLRWVADFRDPWTDIHYYEKLNRLKPVEKYDRALELSVLKEAQRVICISKRDIEFDFGRKVAPEKCINIPNGYDEEDFEGLTPPPNNFKGFTLLHLGSIGAERTPVNLFKAIQELHRSAKINPETFRLLLIGSVEPSVFRSIKDHQCAAYIKHYPYLPHKEALSHSVNASALILLITQSGQNRRILPGKIFEYMRMHKPILALGPEDGEVARILNESRTGKVIDYGNRPAILDFLKNNINAPDKKTSPGPNSFIENYSRKNLTKKLAEVFDQLSN